MLGDSFPRCKFKLHLIMCLVKEQNMSQLRKRKPGTDCDPVGNYVSLDHFTVISYPRMNESRVGGLWGRKLTNKHPILILDSFYETAVLIFQVV